MPLRLVINGCHEILSNEGSTQGDPLAMPWFSLNSVTIIEQLVATDPSVKQVWLADDATAGGKLWNLNGWYKRLNEIGTKYGYHINKKKCWLILKSESKIEEAKAIFGDTINITTEGQRHLRAVIGSKQFKGQYCKEKVKKWENGLQKLCDIAKSEPQAAYIAYTKGFFSKMTYFFRTIQGFQEYIEPIDALLEETFLPVIFGQEEKFDDVMRRTFNMPTRDGGLGIKQ